MKSCSTIRATTNGISSFAGFFAFQFAKRFDIFALNFLAVAISQHRFEHDANADGQSRNFSDALLFQRRQRMQQSFAAFAGIKFLAAF